MAVLRCDCGKARDLWGELWWVGGQHRWVYFDEDDRNETYTEQVENCPGCGKRLERKNLKLMHPVR